MSIKNTLNIINSNKYNDKISEYDVKASLKSFLVLGHGCEIVNDQYINISPFSFNMDVKLLIKHYEEFKVIRKKEVVSILEWIDDRFNLAIVF